MDERLPLVESLPSDVTALGAFRHLSAQPHVAFLDSAVRDPQLGRYSFVAADPVAWIESHRRDDDGLGNLDECLQRWRSAPVAGLPPFQGGAVTMFGYELAGNFEKIEPSPLDEFQMPRFAAGIYDVVLAFDHQQSEGWIISHGFPEQSPAARRARAAQRLEHFRDLITTESLAAPLVRAPSSVSSGGGQRRPMIPQSQLAPQYATDRHPWITSDFSAGAYQDAVARAIEYIYDGDIFQVNLSQRLLHPATDASPRLYERLRERNPATFAAYFDLGLFQLCSASPERFLRVVGREVETRPIKGTRARTAIPEADLFAADELRLSDKDMAENVMIVDLLRNDLARVCTADSIRVTQLCEIESYEYVQHLVSAVEGRLRDDAGPLALVKACFPGGSITGAPKVRAMQIISELEPTVRGPYCGALGYVGFDGQMDTSILIRTITAGRGWWQLPVGGGIVALSDPLAEYRETWHKAEGMIRALEP